MSENPIQFDYTNLSGRPPGPFVQLGSALFSGVRSVQQQIEPYAHAWRADNLEALAGDGPLWVALGDSMTLGIGASDHRHGWVGQLADTLRQDLPALRVVNLAASGARVSDVLERQLPALRSLGVQPDLVTLLIGSNDVMRRKYREGFAERFTTLLTELPHGTVSANLPGVNPAVVAVNQELRAANQDGRIVLADLRANPHQSWKGRLAADHFHPNDLGYAGMAAVFEGAVRRSPLFTVHDAY